MALLRPSCIEPAIRIGPFRVKSPRAPLQWVTGDIDTLADIVAKAVSKGPYILGEQFTTADVVIGSGLRWGTMFKLIPERPEFKPYIERLTNAPHRNARTPRTRNSPTSKVVERNNL